MANPRIVLITGFFGPFPLWFPAFMLSCRYNPDVDWLFFSDYDPPPHCPLNLKWLKTDLESFNRLASNKLEVKVQVTPSFLYKLVELKPMLGKIFEDSLRGYAFWGHCDVDIVWGQIRTFMEPGLLEQYDLITSRIGKISGHFCLYRNVPDMTMLFLKIPNVLSMIQAPDKKCGITERIFTPFLWSQIRPSWLTRVKRLVLGIQPLNVRVFWDKVLTTSAKHQRLVGDELTHGLRWKRGRTYDLDGEEMMYIHMHVLKRTLQEINFGYEDDPAEFVITKTKITTI